MKVMLAFGRGGGGEAGIVGEDVGLVVELADIDDIGALGAGIDRQLVALAFDSSGWPYARRLDLALSHAQSPCPSLPVYHAPLKPRF